jgi:hypothetical protein
MKALSVRAPWWWFILHGGKDIENRDWPTRFRGTIYLHVGKWWKNDEVMDDIMAALSCCGTLRTELARKLCIDRLKDTLGSIVGTVDIVDCVTRSHSPWFFGEYGFALENPVAFARPIPFRGALGFFDVPNGIHEWDSPAFSEGETDSNGVRAAVPVSGVQERGGGAGKVLQPEMQGSRLEGAQPEN